MNRNGATSNGDYSPPALETEGLTKNYGRQTILSNLLLHLPSGSLVGLLGPNGAGKSTLLKLLAGLIVPDAGSIHIAGLDLARQEVKARASLAYVPDVPNLYPELTVIEHLELVARAHRTLATFDADAEEALRRFGMWEARNSAVFALSRGMTQKVALCCAFIRPSRVLLLDEPGSSLDIDSLAQLHDFLREYREYGGMALISSHQWETLQDLCDNFVLLGQGRVAGGDIGSLREAFQLERDADLRDVYLAFRDSRRTHPHHDAHEEVPRDPRRVVAQMGEVSKRR